MSHGIIERDDLDLSQSVHLFFALNGALLDASVATWEAKRYYDYVRPASAIRWYFSNQQVAAWGGPDKGTQTILVQHWSPYQSITFVTPPFPEYVSGHSAFSRASAEVLTMFTGSGTFYDGSTTTLQDVNNDGELDLLGQHIAPAGTFFIEQGPVNDVVLQWDTFIDAADEAGISRLYGGIHIQDGDLRGRELGRKIGVNAYDEAMRYINGTHEGDDSRIVAVCEDHDGDGYGWNGVETCIPDAVNPNPGSDIGDNTVVDDPSLSCLDPDGDGYGWNGVETCFPDGFDPQPVSDIRVDMVAGDQLLTCIDSDGDGYGWNGIESCQPVTPDDEVRNIVCVDADGDGYGWTGSQSCRFDEDGSIVLL